jgi:chromate transporter
VAAGVVGLIAVTTIELGYRVATSVPSLPLAGIIAAAALAVLYLWKSKLNLPATVLGSAAFGMFFWSAWA